MKVADKKKRESEYISIDEFGSHVGLTDQPVELTDQEVSVRFNTKVKVSMNDKHGLSP